MAVTEFSFDIVSRADKMEVKNALDQAERDLANRYDLKGSKCEILVEKDDTTLIADDEFKMDQLKEIVFSKPESTKIRRSRSRSRSATTKPSRSSPKSRATRFE